MTLEDTVYALSTSGILRRNPDTNEYEFALIKPADMSAFGPGIKSELLTWVPYMIQARGGDAGILNVPREPTSVAGTNATKSPTVPPPSFSPRDTNNSEPSSATDQETLRGRKRSIEEAA
ncbi:hypothetical protein BCR43DRAFT_179367 [Syncephalastrum racemosum]|uniref:Uncharacterized protein n=1 Tax=Syncephalastrum racemosum TaxID=13706 RepID=A0A1X2HQ01_SYNRA|nr:hypothetical protein BCR43DRAFT_179367 [Syncephalastrum racemosum]